MKALRNIDKVCQRVMEILIGVMVGIMLIAGTSSAYMLIVVDNVPKEMTMFLIHSTLILSVLLPFAISTIIRIVLK